ncbi:MAG: alpha/beta fold hydrolase [Woeseiaceae bacterium]|nr:alpha/beta fold hydrolase [Woeseiaceae bacterium]
MPYITINGARLHYTDTQQGNETILFSHGLLLNGEMFEAQIDALRHRFRCIAYDHRGQGKSEVTESGYDIDSLTDDAAALIDALGIAPCHFVGLSMGGFVGMRLGFRKPDLLKSLTLMETSADPEAPERKRRYALLNFVARWFGLGSVANRVMPIMFGRTFLNDPSRAEERDRWRTTMSSGDTRGINRSVEGVIRRQGVADEIAAIRLPTLVLVGDEDAATPPERAERIRAAIPGARLKIIPGAGHSSTIEQPQLVTEALSEFLA